MLLLLFDVYLTWARIEKQTIPSSESRLGPLAQQPIVIQYMFFRQYYASSSSLRRRLTLLCSGPVRLVHNRFPSEHPIFYIIPSLAAKYHRPDAAVQSPEFSIDSLARIVLDQIISNLDGHLGI